MLRDPQGEKELLEAMAGVAASRDGQALLEHMQTRLEEIKDLVIDAPEDKPHLRGQGRALKELIAKVRGAQQALADWP